MHADGTPAGPDDPSMAGVYEYLTGGHHDHNAADKALAEEMTDPVTGYPGLRELAGENRAFVLAAARWCATMLGITQFIDIGCGFPTVPMVHDRVRAAAGMTPGAARPARVAYVDKDPVVVRHVRCVQDQEGWEGTAVIEADAEDPAAVLAGKGLLELIDLGEPACLILGATLSGMGAEAARDAVAGFAEAMAPGSAAVISCASFADAGLGSRMARAFRVAGAWHNHSAADVASFFAAGALRLVHGRPMDVACWPACSADGPAGAACVLGGAGIRD